LRNETRRHATKAGDKVVVSPCTRELEQAKTWLNQAGERSRDGVVAKRMNEIYRPGERAMVEVKRLRTADCVVGEFRYGPGSFDHVTGDRFRHGTKLMRWRPAKAPAQCTFAQLPAPIGSAVTLSLLSADTRPAGREPFVGSDVSHPPKSWRGLLHVVEVQSRSGHRINLAPVTNDH
jgi:ATP-dependent DNA ligase